MFSDPSWNYLQDALIPNALSFSCFNEMPSLIAIAKQGWLCPEDRKDLIFKWTNSVPCRERNSIKPVVAM